MPRSRSSPRRSRRLSPRKSHKKSHRYSPRRSPLAKLSPLRFISRNVDYLGVGECRGKYKKACYSDPNCSWRRNIGCVRGKGLAEAGVSGSRVKLRYGPVLPQGW